MHTDSSASRTYLASRSASEWTTTVLIPISRHARWMRSAISPRLAISILSKSGFGGLVATRARTGGRLFEDDQRLAELDRLSVLGQDPLDDPGLDGIADLDEGLGARRCRAVERAHHRALDQMTFRHRRCRRSGGRRGRYG